MSKLCFGSFAKVLKGYYNSNGETLVSDLLRGIKEDISVEKGNASRLINSKAQVSRKLIDMSQTPKVINSIEEYFSSYIIPNLKIKMKNHLIEYLQRLILGDNNIPSKTKESLICFDNEDFSKFLSQIFLYAIIQNNVVEKPLENLGELEIPKDPQFTQTSIPDDFNNIFIEVEQNNTLGLLNNNHIKTFHFNIENYEFTFKALDDYLLDNIGSYIYSRMQVDELITNKSGRSISLRAIRALKQKIDSNENLDNELGNIGIYLFLENILKAPKLYTSIECFDSALEKAGVHLLQLNNENISFQMVFSKSHITNRLKDSIDKVFDGLLKLKESRDKHYKFLEMSILNQNFDDATSKKLKNIIIPQKRGADISVNNAYGILLGYTLDINKKVGNEEYIQNVKLQMIQDLQANIPYIVSKINQLGLQNSSFYIYLIPFNDADNDKTIIMNNLVGG